MHVNDINVMYCITLFFENPLRIIKNYTMGWGLKNFWTGIWEVCGGHLTLRWKSGKKFQSPPSDK